MSSSTTGAENWSDGYVYYPNRLSEPSLRVCRSENVIFWTADCQYLDDDDLISTDEPSDPVENLEYADDPTADDYRWALENGLGNREDRLFHLRVQLWWTSNTRRRMGHQTSLLPYERENLEAILSILRKRPPTSENTLVEVEILRELSRFSEAVALLKGSKFTGDLSEFADKIAARVLAENPHVFNLEEETPALPISQTQEFGNSTAKEESLPTTLIGNPQPPEVRRRYYNQQEVVQANEETADKIGLGVIDLRVLQRELEPSSLVLDAGCGVGRVALGLWSLGFKSINACDFAKAPLALARERASQQGASVHFFEADIRELSIEDEFYDCVVCLGNTLDELDSETERNEVMNELARVVKFGGKIIFSRRCDGSDTEVRHLLKTPQLVGKGGWSGGTIGRDHFFGELTQAEVTTFGYRCYHVAQRSKPLALPPAEDTLGTNWPPPSQWTAVKRQCSRDHPAFCESLNASFKLSKYCRWAENISEQEFVDIIKRYSPLLSLLHIYREKNGTPLTLNAGVFPNAPDDEQYQFLKAIDDMHTSNSLDRLNKALQFFTSTLVDERRFDIARFDWAGRYGYANFIKTDPTLRWIQGVCNDYICDLVLSIGLFNRWLSSTRPYELPIFIFVDTEIDTRFHHAIESITGEAWLREGGQRRPLREFPNQDIG